jgi:hypothetical protein
LFSAAVLVCGISIILRSLPKPERNGFAGSVLIREEQSQPVEIGGSYRYVLTRGEVISFYNGARSFFNSYHDEAAKRNLNRILESNASTAIKNKARLLKSYTEAPGFDTLKDRFSYAEVSSEPVLYRDCYVLWRGVAANLETTADKTRFDLLVGYDTRKIMEGAVPVELNFPAGINTTEPLEILGRIVLVRGDGKDQFMLEGIGIHQSP